MLTRSTLLATIKAGTDCISEITRKRSNIRIRGGGSAHEKTSTIWSGLAIIICSYSPRGRGARREMMLWRGSMDSINPCPLSTLLTKTRSPIAARSPSLLPRFSLPRSLQTRMPSLVCTLKNPDCELIIRPGNNSWFEDKLISFVIMVREFL